MLLQLEFPPEGLEAAPHPDLPLTYQPTFLLEVIEDRVNTANTI